MREREIAIKYLREEITRLEIELEDRWVVLRKWLDDDKQERAKTSPAPAPAKGKKPRYPNGSMKQALALLKTAGKPLSREEWLERAARRHIKIKQGVISMALRWQHIRRDEHGNYALISNSKANGRKPRIDNGRSVIPPEDELPTAQDVAANTDDELLQDVRFRDEHLRGLMRHVTNEERSEPHE